MTTYATTVEQKKMLKSFILSTHQKSKQKEKHAIVFQPNVVKALKREIKVLCRRIFTAKIKKDKKE